MHQCRQVPDSMLKEMSTTHCFEKKIEMNMFYFVFYFNAFSLVFFVGFVGDFGSF